MMDFGILTGERISDAEYVFKWRILWSYASKGSVYSSIDLGFINTNFLKCRLHIFVGPMKPNLLIESFFMTASDDFLSRNKALSLDCIILDFDGERYVTNYLKQFPKLDFIFNLATIIDSDSSTEVCGNWGLIESVFELKFRQKPFESCESCLIRSLEITKKHEENMLSLQNYKLLTEDMKNLYTQTHFTDFTIYVKNDKIRTHKAILSARSLVFQRMFMNGDKEFRTFEISDCDPVLFRKFLKYLYCGEIGTETLDTVIALYTIAAQYEVQSLQSACSDIIQSRFASDGVEAMVGYVDHVLDLALYHNDQKLKDIAKHYAESNISVVKTARDRLTFKAQIMGDKESYQGTLYNIGRFYSERN